MPLSPADSARLYNDAFQRNSKAQLGESAFACADLKTQLDVAGYAAGVLQDEITAAQKELAEVKAERDVLAAKWAASTEGKDEALQASADAGAAKPPRKR